MKIPKSINIGPHNIPIKLVKNLTTHTDIYGYFDASCMEIAIDTSISDSHKKEVFWHEVIEAINTLFELRLEHPKIQTLGVALAQMSEDIGEK